MNLCPWRFKELRRGEVELLPPPCSPEEFHWSPTRGSRSGQDKTLKESGVMGVEYEMSLFFFAFGFSLPTTSQLFAITIKSKKKTTTT